jgi:ketosteroid isomerase-like protein
MRCKIAVAGSRTPARPGFDLSLDPFMSGFESQIELQDQNMRTSIKLDLIILAFALPTTNKLNASPEEDAKAVAALDAKYQAAVKANDATTMDQILADDFILVTGRGSVFSKADLIDSARKKEVTYERQDEEPGTQKVRVWGNTAVVTALLWIKSVRGNKPADYKLWFSDTYVRTPTGWRYVFGQASLPLPKTEPPAKPPAREKPSE